MVFAVETVKHIMQQETKMESFPRYKQEKARSLSLFDFRPGSLFYTVWTNVYCRHKIGLDFQTKFKTVKEMDLCICCFGVVLKYTMQNV